MRYAYKHKKYDGSVMLLYPLLYGILRFTDESFRGESVHSVLGMTVSQAVALSMFLSAACAYVVLFQTIWRAPVVPSAPASTERA
jgi:prolipoprotein diacylglyceryltransferase